MNTLETLKNNFIKLNNNKTFLVIFIIVLFILNFGIYNGYSYFPYIFFGYISLSLFYYLYTNNKTDRNTIFTMWKTYFTIITLLYALSFNLIIYEQQIKSDYYKTKLRYQLKINSNKNILNNTFKNFEEHTLNYISLFKMEDYENTNNKTKLPFVYRIPIMLRINITIFMFLWGFKELSYFKKEEEIKN